jgi:hypothetical protein
MPYLVGSGRGAAICVAIDEPVFRIGRAQSCELVLADETVSRLHAEIAAASVGWFLRNFSRTNPVVRNEVAVESSCALVYGDRLRFGAVTLSFVESPGEADDGHGETERVVPGSLAEAALSGAADDPVEVLSMLANAGRSGRVEFEGDGPRVRIQLDGGRIVAARCGVERGMDALLRLAEIRPRRFVVRSGVPPADADGFSATPFVLLELARRRDEVQRQPPPQQPQQPPRPAPQQTRIFRAPRNGGGPAA